MRLLGHLADLIGKRFGLLRRVSTDDQVENYRFEQQELRTREWLEDLGAKVVLYDENEDGGGTSGRDLEKRPKARRLLDDVEAGVLDGLAAYDVSRVTREEYGVDAGVIFQRIANARGLILADRRVYDPRDGRDLEDLRRLANEAARNMLTIRDIFWDGIFGKAEKKPFFQGLPPFGYAVRYDVVPDPRGRRSTPKLDPVPIKNPEHAEAMADLIGLLDACTTKGAVLLHWNKKWGHLAVAHATKSRRKGLVWSGRYGAGWAPSKITDMLGGDVSGVYTGHFAMGRRAFGKKALAERARRAQREGRPAVSESPIWDFWKDKLDKLAHVVDGVTPCSCGESHAGLGDLSYWTPAQARAWAEKFNRGPRQRTTKHEHLLKGILACAFCHQPLVGGGRNGYSCPQRQHGACKGQHIGEGAAWRALGELLPTLLEDAERFARFAAAEVAAGANDRELRDLESKQTNARARVAYLSEQCFGDDVDVTTVPDAEVAALKRAEERVKELAGLIAAERAKLADVGEADRIVRTISRRTLESFGKLPLARQAQTYRHLVRALEVVGSGSGNGRSWEIRGYVSLTRPGPDGRIAGGVSRDVLAYIATAVGVAA
jgi:hypothetical protein